jgi:hypothetical protein
MLASPLPDPVDSFGPSVQTLNGGLVEPSEKGKPRAKGGELSCGVFMSSLKAMELLYKLLVESGIGSASDPSVSSGPSPGVPKLSEPVCPFRFAFCVS